MARRPKRYASAVRNTNRDIPPNGRRHLTTAAATSARALGSSLEVAAKAFKDVLITTMEPITVQVANSPY